MGLFSSLGTGVKDFFYEPTNAIITNPSEVGKIGRGVVKGTLSLVSNTAEGVLGTGTTITRSFGRGAAKLSMDETFILEREKLHRPARSLTDAGVRPVKDIMNGVYCGIAGVVTVPYRSWRMRKSAYAVSSGIAKGVAGLALKPIVGVLDAITHTGEALRDAVRVLTKESVDPTHRIRFANQFGPDGRILPYSYATALGTYVLESLERSRTEGVGNVINESYTVITTVGRFLTPCRSGANKRDDHADLKYVSYYAL